MKKALKIVAVSVVCVLIVAASGFAVYKVNYENADQTAAVAVISQGSRGETVRQIQQKLKRWGYYKGSVDGVYGAQTVAAVKYFQRKNGLAADGKAGPKTLAAMGISVSSSGSSSGGKTNSYSNSDINLLARLVYGEARGESYTGQVAVAAKANAVKAHGEECVAVWILQPIPSAVVVEREKSRAVVKALFRPSAVARTVGKRRFIPIRFFTAQNFL